MALPPKRWLVLTFIVPLLVCTLVVAPVELGWLPDWVVGIVLPPPVLACGVAIRRIRRRSDVEYARRLSEQEAARRAAPYAGEALKGYPRWW